MFTGVVFCVWHSLKCTSMKVRRRRSDQAASTLRGSLATAAFASRRLDEQLKGGAPPCFSSEGNGGRDFASPLAPTSSICCPRAFHDPCPALPPHLSPIFLSPHLSLLSHISSSPYLPLHPLPTPFHVYDLVSNHYLCSK